jgi:hypothetical protein
MIDLDSDPTKLIEVVAIGKQLLMTRGRISVSSILTMSRNVSIARNSALRDKGLSHEKFDVSVVGPVSLRRNRRRWLFGSSLGGVLPQFPHHDLRAATVLS